MNILEPKIWRQELLPFIKDLQFDKKKIEIKGTSGLKSQRFFSDYDLYVEVTDKPDMLDAFRMFIDILEDTSENPNMYFIEGKLQDTKGDKFKFFKEEDMTRDKFEEFYNDLSYVKFDYVVYVEREFIELSIIYNFDSEGIDFEKSLLEDYKELIKDGSYYKALKRGFTLAKLNDDREALIKLTKFFNSAAGEKYKLLGNLKAIRLLLDHYEGADIIDKVILNLKNVKVSPKISDIDKEIKQLTDYVNKEALKFSRESL